jgi:peroxiredoxin Q/BCP
MSSRRKATARKSAGKSARKGAARRTGPGARRAAPANRKPGPRKPGTTARKKTAPKKSAPKKSVPKKSAAARRPATAPVSAPSAERVRIDQPVAEFTAPATGGSPWRLQDARGRKLVLYFYPRDNTPGCTLEGQQFAALAPQFAAAGVTLLGISRDSIASHEKFREQMQFPFDLLSDGGEAICRQFDVIREKNLYGRRVLGIERSTFLLDAAGVLRREWRGVKVDGHAQEVLTAAQAL